MKFFKTILFPILFVVLVFLARYLLNGFVEHEDEIVSWIENFGVLGPIAFVALFVLTAAFFVPATPLIFVSPILFGIERGFLYSMIGTYLGCIPAFLFARHSGRKFIRALIGKYLKKVERYEDKLHEHAFKTIFTLRLIPIFPFNVLNLFFALSKVKFKDYLLATIIGTIPGTFLMVIIGRHIIFGSTVVAIIIAVGIAIALFWKRYRYVRNGNNSDIISKKGPYFLEETD